MHYSRIFGLALAVAAGCTTEPPSGEPYEGSCPILIECADLIATPDQRDLYRAAYGVDGNCWAHGPNYWQDCRDSCVDALVSINAIAQAVGESCGRCETDSDCASFGAGARCEAAWCARPRLGADGGDSTETGTPNDEGEGSGGSGPSTVEGVDPECLARGYSPRVVIDTNYGAMTFEIDREAAESVADSFLRHVSADFYDNTIVHRVSDGLLFQSGVYGRGPVPRTGALLQDLGSLPTLSHEDAVIALVVEQHGVAAQWYVTDGAQPQLDGAGAVFGHLVEGIEVRDQISAVPVDTYLWNDYQLLEYPSDEIIINDVSCVE